MSIPPGSLALFISVCSAAAVVYLLREQKGGAVPAPNRTRTGTRAGQPCRSAVQVSRAGQPLKSAPLSPRWVLEAGISGSLVRECSDRTVDRQCVCVCVSCAFTTDDGHTLLDH